MNKAIKIAMAVLATAGIVFAAATTNDLSTTTYATSSLTLTGGFYKIAWTDTKYTNLTSVEIQLITTALAISCRVNQSTFTFTTNGGATAASTVKPWRILQGGAEGISTIVFPLSILDGQYIDLWNPQPAGVVVKVILK